MGELTVAASQVMEPVTGSSGIGFPLLAVNPDAVKFITIVFAFANPVKMHMHILATNPTNNFLFIFPPMIFNESIFEYGYNYLVNIYAKITPNI